MKAVMISINPKRCSLIASGKVTLEIRKNRPDHLLRPFVCYIYCAKGKENDPHELLEIHDSKGKIHKANGKVIGEFICDDSSLLRKHHLSYIEKCAMITKEELFEYLGVSELQDIRFESMECYGWHISELKIYDEPREPSEFTQCNKCFCFKDCRTSSFEGESVCGLKMEKAPKNWCYVECLF